MAIHHTLRGSKPLRARRHLRNLVDANIFWYIKVKLLRHGWRDETETPGQMEVLFWPSLLAQYVPPAHEVASFEILCQWFWRCEADESCRHE